MNVIIIGGGASGVLNALYLKKHNKDLKVTIIEKNERILKKILKTGSGRCNISNLDMDPKYYNNYKFIEELYSKIKPVDVGEFFKEMGLLFKQDHSTRLYPYSEAATTVVSTLVYELNKEGVEIITEEEVIEINKTNNFTVKTIKNTYQADYIVVASGSIAQEDSLMYSILGKLGHTNTKLTPGLVPLKVKEETKTLMGIKVKCDARVLDNGTEIFQEYGELLFRENSLSGVLVLNLSRYAKHGMTISLDLFPNEPQIEEYILSFIEDKNIVDILSSLLPKMLATYIVKLANNNVEEVLKVIRNLEFNVIADYGFKIAQITLGGININEINADFESKVISDLYIIGELLDIDGSSGGYNLHFAWASGMLSAKAILKKISSSLLKA